MATRSASFSPPAQMRDQVRVGHVLGGCRVGSFLMTQPQAQRPDNGNTNEHIKTEKACAGEIEGVHGVCPRAIGGDPRVRGGAG